MRERARRDEVDARLGDGADGVERHVARRLGPGDPADAAHRLGKQRRVEATVRGTVCSTTRHVVEQQDSRRRPRRAPRALLRASRTSSSISRPGACPSRHCLAAASAERDASGGFYVVVLDEDAVVEADAVVGAAAEANGPLVERAEARRGLARVEDRAAGAAPRPPHSGAWPWRCRTCAASVLSARRSATSRLRARPVAVPKTIPAASTAPSSTSKTHRHVRVDAGEDLRGHPEARHHAVLLEQERAVARVCFRDRGQRCHVAPCYAAGAEVFVERGVEQARRRRQGRGTAAGAEASDRKSAARAYPGRGRRCQARGARAEGRFPHARTGTAHIVLRVQRPFSPARHGRADRGSRRPRAQPQEHPPGYSARRPRGRDRPLGLRESRRSPSTRSTPRASGATWRA